ncbi:MAG: ABC transporter permease [Marinicaulis sp.]|nr:ABC transporter permease [Marinicaulis sp.]NNE41301.1 ABC transporter permease [Marinicaulis sp.]NNL88859.1 ABC transporter permease [Marinicaulis sp.]
MNVFAATGRMTLDAVAEIGRLSAFGVRGGLSSFTGRFYWKAFWSALARIGFTSLPVVGLTAIFTGGALALNIYEGSLLPNTESFLPQILGVSIVRELGPVLAALMVAGRCSSAMAAEIGTMRVTEQIDAMSTLSVDPFKYLVAPRILATTIALPFLVLIADIIGVYGGYLVSVYALKFSAPIYVQNLIDFLSMDDVTSGLIKAAVFGFLISVMGCYYGYTSRGGAGGVGNATRTAVVAAAVAVLSANYFLTSLFVDF